MCIRDRWIYGEIAQETAASYVILIILTIIYAEFYSLALYCVERIAEAIYGLFYWAVWLQQQERRPGPVCTARSLGPALW